MQKILITGSNGLVAQFLITELLKQIDFSIIALSSSSDLAITGNSNYVFEQVNLVDETKTKYLLDIYRPDIIINCAALTHVDVCHNNKQTAWEVNTLVPDFLARYCKDKHIRFIHLSTDFVFDGLRGMYQENDIPNPVSWYGTTKLEAEKRISDIYPDATIVRTVLVYGIPKSTHRNNILTWVLKELKEGKPINVVNDQFRTPTFVKDLVQALIKLAGIKYAGIIHISGCEYMSVFDFAIKIASVFELDKSLIKPTTSQMLNQPGKRPPKTGFIITKAMHELDFTPTSISEGLGYFRNLLK